MGKITIGELNDKVIAVYRSRAQAAGHSLEDELRTQLEQGARAEIAARFAETRARIRERYGILPDSTPLIRQDRDERG